MARSSRWSAPPRTSPACGTRWPVRWPTRSIRHRLGARRPRGPRTPARRMRATGPQCRGVAGRGEPLRLQPPAPTTGPSWKHSLAAPMDDFPNLGEEPGARYAGYAVLRWARDQHGIEDGLTANEDLKTFLSRRMLIGFTSDAYRFAFRRVLSRDRAGGRSCSVCCARASARSPPTSPRWRRVRPRKKLRRPAITKLKRPRADSTSCPRPSSTSAGVRGILTRSPGVCARHPVRQIEAASVVGRSRGGARGWRQTGRACAPQRPALGQGCPWWD